MSLVVATEYNADKSYKLAECNAAVELIHQFAAALETNATRGIKTGLAVYSGFA